MNENGAVVKKEKPKARVLRRMKLNGKERKPGDDLFTEEFEDLNPASVEVLKVQGFLEVFEENPDITALKKRVSSLEVAVNDLQVSMAALLNTSTVPESVTKKAPGSRSKLKE